MWDGQRALKLLRANASALHIDPDRIALLGFSAGGHLASTLALHDASDFDLPTHDEVDRGNARPTLLALGYPVLSMDPVAVPPSGSYRNLLKNYNGRELQHLQTFLSGEKNVTAHTLPVFLFESLDDAVISPQNSILFVNALQLAGASVEPHLFPHGVHGDGLATGVPGEDTWPNLFALWLQREGFLPNSPGSADRSRANSSVDPEVTR